MIIADSRAIIRITELQTFANEATNQEKIKRKEVEV